MNLINPELIYCVFSSRLNPVFTAYPEINIRYRSVQIEVSRRERVHARSYVCSKLPGLLKVKLSTFEESGSTLSIYQGCIFSKKNQPPLEE